MPNVIKYNSQYKVQFECDNDNYRLFTRFYYTSQQEERNLFIKQYHRYKFLISNKTFIQTNYEKNNNENIIFYKTNISSSIKQQ